MDSFGRGWRVTDSFSGQTVETVRRALTAQFKSNDVDSAELDARILVGAALDLDFTGVIAAASRPPTMVGAIRLVVFSLPRLSGLPIARIIRVKDISGLPLKV